MATIVSEQITATWETSGAGTTGLTPSIRIIDLSDNSTILTSTMTAVDATNCPGTYKYTFTTFDVSKKYVARIDGGVGTEDRYRTLQLRSPASEVYNLFNDAGVLGPSGRGVSTLLIEKLLKHKINDKTVEELLGAISTTDLQPLEKKIDQSKNQILAYGKKCHEDSIQELSDLVSVVSSMDNKKVILGAIQEAKTGLCSGQVFLSEFIQQKSDELKTSIDNSKTEVIVELGKKEELILSMPEEFIKKTDEKTQRMRMKQKKLLLLNQ